jgi:hypothetical protein
MLSVQELQIARLAAQGMSNREIAERMFLSPRTVGSHLCRTYPKLNIPPAASWLPASQTPDPGGGQSTPSTSVREVNHRPIATSVTKNRA